METHLTRLQLQAAASMPEAQWPDHLRTCRVCRECLAMLQKFPIIGRLPLHEPPEAWVQKAKKIATLGGVTTLVTRLVGKLVFDSWLLPHPAGVRGGSLSTERRLRFDIAPISIDLRVERRGKGWSSIAQITGTEGKSVNLLINGRVIAQGAGGMAQYTGSQPPRTIELQVDGQTVELPEVSWRKRRTS